MRYSAFIESSSAHFRNVYEAYIVYINQEKEKSSVTLLDFAESIITYTEY